MSISGKKIAIGDICFEPFVAATPEDAEKWVVDRVETLSNALGESYKIRATFSPDIID
jgi:hypothetical protein